MEPFVFRNSIDPLDKLSLEVISGEDCGDFITFRAIVDYKTISFHIVKKNYHSHKRGYKHKHQTHMDRSILTTRF